MREESSRTRGRTCVSCISRRVPYHQAIRGAPASLLFRLTKNIRLANEIWVEVLCETSETVFKWRKTHLSLSLPSSHFFNLIFNCRKIALQCCVGFCHTTAWISHNYTHVPQLLHLPPLPPSHRSRSSQSIKLGSLCYVATSHQLSIWHMVVYTCQCYFLHSSYSLLPPLHPQVCSLYLCLHSFLANRFINTIFLDSIYML